MAKELASPISSVGSFKFYIDPMLSTLSKDEIIKIVGNHISFLTEQKDYWSKWSAVKADDSTLGLTRISFEMAIQSINNQILWHEELIKNLDEYIKASINTENIVKSLDFNMFEEENSSSADREKLKYAMKLKEEILNDPQNAVANLDKIIEQLKTQI